MSRTCYPMYTVKGQKYFHVVRNSVDLHVVSYLQEKDASSSGEHICMHGVGAV